MAKKVSSTAIGAFVVGSLALTVAAAVILGSGKLFSKQHEFVCFFSGSLNGLNAGAPVKFRGVQVGAVKTILLRIPPSEGTIKKQVLEDFSALPVIIEIDESQLRARGGTGRAATEYSGLIQRGLRAQLHSQSILTGLLYVDIDFHPDTPVNLALEPGASIAEIPTTPTDIQQIQETAMRAMARLDKIDFEKLIQSITNAASSIHELASSPSLKDTITTLKLTAGNMNKAVVAIQGAVANANSKIDPLVTSLKKASDAADVTLRQTSATMADLQMTIQPGSPFSYQLNDTVQELGDASRSIRELADYLERNPSAIVRGKYVGAQ
ncbi:MAG TPA: MlaD family protein [Candidatus Binataceae bacterium]